MTDDSMRPADDLNVRARRRFGNKLSKAEELLLRAVRKGDTAKCGSNYDVDPAKADESWGYEREIRAEVIRWLCINPRASATVDPRGILVCAARIIGKLDLSYSAVPFPLRLYSCRIRDGADFSYTKIPVLDLKGSSTGPINADSADVADVYLNGGFSAQGEVRLLGAQIGIDLVCSQGTFKNPGGDALSADGAVVKGSVFLNDGFSAEGRVGLTGVQIGGDVVCEAGALKNSGGVAFSLSRAKVDGSVYLRKGFSADGDLDLSGAQIGRTLSCSGGSLRAVNLEMAIVKGVFWWTDVKKWGTSLDLTNASFGAIVDDKPSWPVKGGLRLDGFVYGRIAKGPTDAQTRLDWLDLEGRFKPQPYRQLAKVLREMGDDDGAKQVLFEMESRARVEDRRRIVHAPLRWLQFGEDVLSDATVGYGIYPGRAIWCLGGLTALGWILYRRAQRAGAMAPTDKDAYAEFREKGRAPAHYPPFSPLIYSLENCVPLVKFGQDRCWQPDPNPQQRDSHSTAAGEAGLWGRLNKLVLGLSDVASSSAVLRWFRWIMIGLGWLLATFFVAGLTGIIKTS